MVNSIAEKIVSYAVSIGSIKEEQHEEYLYGLNLILNAFITDVTLIVIGCVMDMLWETLLFWLVYRVLRKYCGGFHFSTSLRCYLSTCIMCPVVLLIIRYIPYFELWQNGAVVLSVIILFLMSPVEAANKPLDEDERRVFRKVSIILLIVISLIYFAMIICGFTYVAKITALSVIWVAVFAVIGKLFLVADKK